MVPGASLAFTLYRFSERRARREPEKIWPSDALTTHFPSERCNIASTSAAPVSLLPVIGCELIRMCSADEQRLEQRAFEARCRGDFRKTSGLRSPMLLASLRLLRTHKRFV